MLRDWRHRDDMPGLRNQPDCVRLQVVACGRAPIGSIDLWFRSQGELPMVGGAGNKMYLQDISGTLESAIGSSGLSDSELQHWLRKAGDELAGLREDHRVGKLPMLDVANDIEASVVEVEAAYDRLAAGARTIIFFGTGGSSLGGQAVAQFGGWSIAGTTTDEQRRRPMTRFYGNLDPDTLQGVLSRPDLDAVRFVLVSKSGGTPETLSQALAALDAVRRAGLTARIGELFLAISDPAVPRKSNALRNICARFNIPVLDHPPGIGGRFAVLTCVGLLPAVARGMDARRLLVGAQSVVDNVLTDRDPKMVPAAVGAAVAVGLDRERGVRAQIMMPYADRLAQFAHWFVQLWAESLGKNGQGTTPLACLGPLDHHSQLQLFMDGPNEHYLTFIRVPVARTGPSIPADLAELAQFDVMADKTVGDLVAAQTVAVPEALRRAGRAVRLIDVPRLDEVALGGLLMHFMIETVLSGRLMAVDPFGQPAVELGKQLTREHLAGES